MKLLRVVLTAIICLPAIVFAEPFESAGLFLGRAMKPPKKEKTFTAGIRAGVAPLDFALGATRDRLIDEGIAKACGENRTCRTETEAALNKIEGLSDEQWARVESVAADNNALKRELMSLGFSAEESDRIVEYVSKNAGTTEERKNVINLARKVADAKANILLSPFTEVNLDLLMVSAEIPLVLTVFEDKTEAALANINLETRFGHYFDLGLLNLGVSYGLHLYAPTGGTASNAAAYVFLQHAPKYLKSYLSAAPYVVLGLEVPFLTFQTYGEFVTMHKVRSGSGPSSRQYAHYGAGIILFPKFILSLTGELSGLASINNAEDFDALFGLGGLRLSFLFLRAGLAVQAQIYSKATGTTLPDIRGLPVGKLAKIAVLSQFAVEF